jgi:excisionase family DNA binding protein
VIPEGLATLAQAREYLAVSRTTLYELIKAGELPVFQHGARVRVPKAALVEYVAKHTTVRAPPE